MLCLVVPCAFLFSACDVTSGEVSDVQVRVSEDKKYVQWSTDGENWEKVISVDEIKETLGDAYEGKQGPAGSEGLPGANGSDGLPGVNGREVEFRKTDTYIQWRYVGEPETAWKNLVALEDIKGDPAVVQKANITFNYNNPLSELDKDIYDYAVNATSTLSVDCGSWLGDSLPNFDGTVFDGSFQGWYIDGTNVEFTKYSVVGGDLLLKARWDHISFECENCTYYNTLNNGYCFDIDENSKNVVVPDYAVYNGEIGKVVAICRTISNFEYQFHPTPQLESIRLPYFLDYLVNYFSIDFVIVHTPTGRESVVCKNNAKDEGLFRNCVNLKSITMPENSSNIGPGTFYGCKNLRTVVLSKDVRKIDDYAFYGCEKLRRINCQDNQDQGWIIPIGAHAFDGCTELKEVHLSVGCLSEFAFANCCLENLFLGSSIWEFEYGALDRVENLYYDGTVEEWCGITFPEDGPWNSSGKIGHVFMKDEYNEWYEVTNLYIHDDVASIPKRAFYGCTNIESVVIPNSVTSIGFGAFRGCSGLTSITIPDSVMSIDEYSFDGCEALSTIYYMGAAEEWENVDVDFSKNSSLTSATIYYYSEIEPTDAGNYWHYDSDGVTPVIWE